MYRLRLLGGASIERDDGTPLVGRAAQRHRLALLSLLACAPGAALRREKLTALLWPESDRERGRNLLKVSVYELRKALGEDAILSAGDDLRLNGAVVGADVADFEGAIARGEPAAAAALYRGPLLDGFFLGDAPEFERWVDGERARLAGAYAGALEALAEAAGRGGDVQGATAWWRRRAAHDPFDARVALALMRALDASGNRAGALQHAAVHERLLQQELELPPSNAVTALAERLRAEPAVATPVEPAAGVPIPAAAAPATPPARAGPSAEASVAPAPVPASVARQPPGAAGGARRRTMRALVLVLLAAAVVTVLLWARGSAAPGPERSVAVLPFVDMSPDGDNEYFSDGVTEEIITRLSAIPDLKVISRTSAMRYKGSAKPLQEIAAELGVAHVLEGSVRREGGEVRITAQLIDAATDAHLWAESYDRELLDVFAVQEEIARNVGQALEVELEAASGALARRGTRDPEAYELYRRGRFLWSTRTREGHEQAIAYYQQAIARDSGYADPYAGLADAYLTSYQLGLASMPEAEVYSRLKWAAERALALDEQSADAHIAFSSALWWQRNWPGAERELRRAIELNPGHASARSWYSLLLGGMGRIDEARQQGRRAAELDPFAVLISLTYAGTLHLARDYAGAVEQYRRTLEINEAWAPTHAWLSVAYAQLGMYDPAIRAGARAVELGPGSSMFAANLAYAYARAGREPDARRLLQRAKADRVDPFGVARVHVALGEPDSAFVWLERSPWQWPHRANLHDPTLDPLRSDPRFTRLSARVEREMGIR